jgi:predicted  nucleic acid-binding Zn-ribbon protein
MKYSVVTKTDLVTEQEKMDHIQQSLKMIEDKLDAEITARQKTIDLQEKEIHRLHKMVEEKSNLILGLNEKLVECTHNSEGSRQLINKLLNDIDRLQQDIEWYKRTYVKRSLVGTIKQKILGPSK